MSPEERDRLLRLEVNAANQEKSVERIAGKVDGLDAKVDALLKAANMGQGAWLVLLKLGGFVVAVVGIVAAVVTVAEKLISLLKH